MFGINDVFSTSEMHRATSLCIFCEEGSELPTLRGALQTHPSICLQQTMNTISRASLSYFDFFFVPERVFCATIIPEDGLWPQALPACRRRRMRCIFPLTVCTLQQSDVTFCLLSSLTDSLVAGSLSCLTQQYSQWFSSV